MIPKVASGTDTRRKEESTEQPGREIWRHGSVIHGYKVLWAP